MAFERNQSGSKLRQRRELFSWRESGLFYHSERSREIPDYFRKSRDLSTSVEMTVDASWLHGKNRNIKNGPYIVTGEWNWIAGWKQFPAEKRMALCRCGASTEKPFATARTRDRLQSCGESGAGIKGNTDV